MDYGDRMCEEMSRVMAGPAFAETSESGDGTCIAFFGRALFLNSIA